MHYIGVPRTPLGTLERSPVCALALVRAQAPRRDR
jgi:hypothetical protein